MLSPTDLMAQVISNLRRIAEEPGEYLEQQYHIAIQAVRKMQRELAITTRIKELDEMVHLRQWDDALRKLEENYPADSHESVVKQVLNLIYDDKSAISTLKWVPYLRAKQRPMLACEWSILR
jgi:hypothetical protein